MRARGSWLVALALVLPGTLFPQVNETILELAVTNYTGYVIDSDADNTDPGFNRDRLRLRTVIRYTNTTAFASNTLTYALHYRLLDSNGAPHPLGPDGTTNLIQQVSYNVSVPAHSSVTRTNSATLDPAVTLNPYTQYRVELRLLEGTNFTGRLTNDTPKAYYHFISRASDDDAYNVIATVNSVMFSRGYAVKTDSDRRSFQVEVQSSFRRYDNYEGSHMPADNVPFTLSYVLRNAGTGVGIPLQTTVTNLTRNIFKYDPPPPSDPIAPRVITETRTLLVEPAEFVQLDPVNATYRLEVTIAHTENPVSLETETGNAVTSPAQWLLHFSGRLFFGTMTATPVETMFTSIANDPSFLGFSGPSFVRSEVAVDANSGFVVGQAAHTYGDGTVLSVLLRSDGDAAVSLGSVTLNAPAPDQDEVAGIDFRRSNIAIGPAGALANVSLTLPTGFGYRLGDTSSRILESDLAFTDVRLNAALAPATDLSFRPGSTLYACEETKPFWIPANAIDWKVNEGRFVVVPAGEPLRYVRAAELQFLETAPPLVGDPEPRFKRSNEQYHRFVDRVRSGSVPTVRPDPGGHALMQIDFDLLPSRDGVGAEGFRTHFPYDVEVRWSGSGRMWVVDDLVQPTDSALNLAEPLAGVYGRDCPGCPSEAGTSMGSFNLRPDGNTLYFTRDGGLSAQGLLTAPQNLQWGYIANLSDPPNGRFAYAQTVSNLTAGGFHMSGCFVRGDENAGDDEDGPAVILLTGVGPALDYIERPSTDASDPYVRDGFADYAGINFRVGADRAKKGFSTLGGVDTGPFDLTGRSKYYARYGGISGIHEAVPGSFPPTLRIYRYSINFSNYGLPYLDSQVQPESTTQGNVIVPIPPAGLVEDFRQEFERLTFTCLGGLDDARIPDASEEKFLDYWAGDINPLTLRFETDVECRPDVAFLVLGVEAFAAHVADKLYGSLGFHPNGNLITTADGVLADINSRLKPPSVIMFTGPAKPSGGRETYTLAPVTDAYYNNPDHAHSPPVGEGFLNVAGALDVPFFQDLQVHYQSGARAAGDVTLRERAPIYLAGGWNDGPDTFFNNAAEFDDDNNGLPPGVPPATYRSNPDPDFNLYRARAQRLWLGVVRFDLPLSWSSASRSFKSSKPVTTNLLVLTVEHQLKYLSAENAEISFGAQYEGLPPLNLANLVFNAVDDLTGVADAFAQAGLSEARGAIEGALGKFDEMLDDQMHLFFTEFFARLRHEAITPLQAELRDAYPAGVDEFAGFAPVLDAKLRAYFQGAASPVPSRLRNIVGAIGTAGSVVDKLDNHLTDIEDAFDDINAVINGTGNARRLVQAIVGELAPDFDGSASNQAVDAALAGVEPSLRQISATLADLRGYVQEVHDQVRAGGEFAAELSDRVNALSGEIDALSAAASNDVRRFFEREVNYAVGSPFADYTPSEIESLIRRKIEDRFFASEVAPSLQQVFRHRLYDADAALREALDSAFQQLNDIIRDLISQTLAQVDKSIAPALGDLSASVGAGQLNGYAHINGDALRELRLDGHFQLKAPDNLEFNAFLRIRELDSEGTAGCTPAGGSATEVSLGATDVDLDWISPNLRANVCTKFTFQSGEGVDFRLLGLAGCFVITGGLDFETFRVETFGAMLAFGALENYLAAEAAISFNNYSAAGGLFFGRSCTLDPIVLIDPQVAELLGDGTTPDHPFTGAYGYVEVWIPISEVALGIPASCVFRIDAGVGAGAGYFMEGPTFIGKMFAGVSGEALCVVHIRGDVTMIGVKQGDEFKFTGSGKIKGKAGACPFCVRFNKTVSLTYQGGDWDVDY